MNPNSQKLADYYRNKLPALPRWRNDGKEEVTKSHNWAYQSGFSDGIEIILNDIFGQETQDN